jgi:hypothetical protein
LKPEQLIQIPKAYKGCDMAPSIHRSCRGYIGLMGLGFDVISVNQMLATRK